MTIKSLESDSRGPELTIRVYTDGACSGNPGPGGWGALILIKNYKTGQKDKVVIKGGEKHTTNNRMELTAVVEALKFISKNMKQFNYDISVTSDSAYVINSINGGSLKRWLTNGWQTTKQTDVLNKDLWEQLIQLIADTESPLFMKVKGHNGNKFNEYVDKVAVLECDKYKRLFEGLM